MAGRSSTYVYNPHICCVWPITMPKAGMRMVMVRDTSTISSNNCLTTPFPLHSDHNHLPLCRLVSSLDGAGCGPTRRPPRRKGTAAAAAAEAAAAQTGGCCSVVRRTLNGEVPTDFSSGICGHVLCAKKLEIEELPTWTT